MKKYFLPFALALFTGFSANTVSAQTDKGSVSLRFLYTIKHHTYGNGTPMLGADYFVRKNLSLGGYASGHIVGGPDRRVAGGFSVMPTVTKYFGDKKLKPYVEGQLSFGMLSVPTYTSANNGELLRATSWGAGVGAGLVYFIGKNTALNVGLNYNISSTSWNDDRFSFNNPGQKLGLNIGLRIFLPGKKSGSVAAAQ